MTPELNSNWASAVVRHSSLCCVPDGVIPKPRAFTSGARNLGATASGAPEILRLKTGSAPDDVRYQTKPAESVLDPAASALLYMAAF